MRVEGTPECKPPSAECSGARMHVLYRRVKLVPQNLHASHPARLARGGSATHMRVGSPKHAGLLPECNAAREPDLPVRVQRPTGTSGTRTGPCAVVHPLRTPDPLRVALRWLLRGTSHRMPVRPVHTPEYNTSYFT